MGNAEKSETGLAWKVLKKGNGGETPGKFTTVFVHYNVWRSNNGELFDSTYMRNEPGEYKVSETIPGWSEAFQMMEVGEKRRVWIPGNLAYGPEEEALVARQMPPKGDLVFDMELVKIDDPGDGIIKTFGIAFVALFTLTLLVTNFTTPAERPEYETEKPFYFKVE